MKNYKSVIDIVLILIIALLAVVSILPKKVTMSSSLEMVVLLLAFILVCLFATLIWRERPTDEREAEIQYLASRSAYLFGCMGLVLALLIEGVRHKIDPAIPLVLLLMIVTKLVVQISKDKK